MSGLRRILATAFAALTVFGAQAQAQDEELEQIDDKA